MNRDHVLILGGGVMGLSAAWELSRRGFHVTIVDRGPLGRSASWAGAGILPAAPRQNAIDPLEQLKALSHTLHEQWADELRQSTGIDTGFRRCGGIHLGLSPAEAATLAGNRYWWDEHNIAYTRLSPEQLIELEPALQPTVNRLVGPAWLLPDEYQLRNPWHLRALMEACRRNGVQMLPGTAIERLDVHHGRVRGAMTAQKRSIEADLFLICTGAWARQFLLDLGFPNGIMPIRGQMILYRSTPHLLSHVINVGNRYLVPRDDGRILAGSVEEEVGYVCDTTPEALADLQRWSQSVVPGLQGVPIEASWAGLRPGSFDGLPYIGPIPGLENAMVAAGHFRSGLHLSCGTAVLVADLLTGRQPPIDLTPFRIGRG
ncbi:MAG: glycine oxidase ThiO [Planctomycetota bacterium]|nr:MAG: glycine oxidase ThiO [Planctomycetota bacterium]